MKAYGRKVCALALMLCMVFVFALGAQAAVGNNKNEIRIPITIKVPHAIAGAEFEISYTSGLKLVSFEKSEAVRSAATTPIVEKNGKTHFGFYSSGNNYVPKDGILDVGYLVFSSTGAAGQSVTINEAKYVEVVDKQTTRSSVITLNDEIGVPLSSMPAAMSGGQSNAWWIALTSLTVIAGGAGLFYTRKKQLASGKQHVSNIL